jgi:hypothetical protein
MNGRGIAGGNADRAKIVSNENKKTATGEPMAVWKAG